MALSPQIAQALLASGIDPNLFPTAFDPSQLNVRETFFNGSGDYQYQDSRDQSLDWLKNQLISNPTGNTASFSLTDPNNPRGMWGSTDNNYKASIDPYTGQMSLRIKSGDKEGTEIPYALNPATGKYEADYAGAKQLGWDTNKANAQRNMMMAIILGGAAGGALFGPEAAAGGSAASPTAAAPSAISGAAEGLWPGLAASGGDYAGLLGAGAAPTGAGLSSGTLAGGLGGSLGGFGNYMALAPEVASGLQGWGTQTGNVAMGGEGASPWGTPAEFGGATPGTAAASGSSSWMSQVEKALGLPSGSLGKAAGAAGSLVSNTGSSNGTGSAIGGLLGAGLGYLDSRNQPDSLTIKSEIDPRLAQYAYGADGNSGIAGAANSLMQQQLAQPNPGVQAGQQISGMANTQPNWSDLVAQSKGQWDANPWIKQQQDAITNSMTRNLQENILPGIGSEANAMGGYGGSRQGVAQALANSRMNADLAPALTGLASNAWESSQNRALNSAQSAGTYGLQNQLQQAGLLGTGAGLQQQGAWAPIQNATNVMGSLPGNTSRTEPLFSNPISGALGGASVGSQIGGGTDWEGLFKSIGGLGGLFGGSGSNSGSGISWGGYGDSGGTGWGADLFPWATTNPYRG